MKPSSGAASVSTQQTRIIMTAVSAALVLACVGFSFFEIHRFRQEKVEYLSSLSGIIGSNTTGALDFQDAEAARETLSALSAEPSILAAALFDRHGVLFAHYLQADRQAGDLPPVGSIGHRFSEDRLELFHPIERADERVGTLYLRSRLDELYQTLAEYGVIALLVLVVSGLVSFFLSRKLQEAISNPILQLVQAARRVAVEKDYSVRAEKRRDDELGFLVDNFNDMLRQIQQRDAALLIAREDLEKRVDERTRELRDEIAERATVETRLLTIQERLDKVLANSPSVIYALKVEDPVTVRAWFTEHQGPEDLGPIWRKAFRTVWVSENIAKISGHSYVGSMRPEWWLENLHPDDHALALTSMVRLFREGSSSDEFRLRNGQGNYFWIRLDKRLVYDSDGNPVELVGSWSDITDRKRTERQLQEANRRLVEASRHAGMAEVATNVLHNVGNVLNSINVSTTLVSERLTRSKVPNLTRAAELLQQDRGDLARFLNDDPKGRQLPAYVQMLADHLNQEHGAILREMESLANNVRHIKEIVAMQQSYARVSGLRESVSPLDLVEDALRMNEGALARHEVEVIRDYERAREIPVEKHKVLQILTNLIRNAKYALDDGQSERKQLTVRIREADGKVRIQVADNGVGIPEENLVKIFSLGFTTRKEGHGFGLHGSVLAAQELGGTLSARSPGPGQGAEFTLELPHEPQAKS